MQIQIQDYNSTQDIQSILNSADLSTKIVLLNVDNVTSFYIRKTYQAFIEDDVELSDCVDLLPDEICFEPITKDFYLIPFTKIESIKDFVIKFAKQIGDFNLVTSMRSFQTINNKICLLKESSVC